MKRESQPHASTRVYGERIATGEGKSGQPWAAWTCQQDCRQLWSCVQRALRPRSGGSRGLQTRGSARNRRGPEEAERLAARRAGWRYYASPAPLDAKPPARPAAPVTPKPAAPVVTPRRRRKTPRRTKPDAARIKELERGWVHHGSRHAPIVDRPPQRSPRRWRKSPSVPDEDVAYDVEEEEYVKIPVALFKNLSGPLRAPSRTSWSRRGPRTTRRSGLSWGKGECVCVCGLSVSVGSVSVGTRTEAVKPVRWDQNQAPANRKPRVRHIFLVKGPILP